MPRMRGKPEYELTDSDSDSDEHNADDKPDAQWVAKLDACLSHSAQLNPEEIFGAIAPSKGLTCELSEVFQSAHRWYRRRESSAWPNST